MFIISGVIGYTPIGLKGETMKKTKVGKFAGTLRVEKELDTLDIKLVSKIQKGFMEYTSEVDVLNLLYNMNGKEIEIIINEIEKVEATK